MQKLRPELLEVIKEIDELIDNQMDMNYCIKILRYETKESFNTFIDDIFSKMYSEYYNIESHKVETYFWAREIVIFP